MSIMKFYILVFGCVLFLEGYEGSLFEKEVCDSDDMYVYSCDPPLWCCGDICCGLSVIAWIGIAIGIIAAVVFICVLIGVGICEISRKCTESKRVVQPQDSTNTSSQQQPSVCHTQTFDGAQAANPPQYSP